MPRTPNLDRCSLSSTENQGELMISERKRAINLELS